MSESRQDFIQRHRLRKGRQTMNESKHTPTVKAGPVLRKVKRERMVLYQETDPIELSIDLVGHTHYQIRDITTDNCIAITFDEVNAALIASAPDLLSDRDCLAAENADLLECLREIEKYEHPGNRDPLTKHTLSIKQIKKLARNRLNLYQPTTNESETE